MVVFFHCACESRAIGITCSASNAWLKSSLLHTFHSWKSSQDFHDKLPLSSLFLSLHCQVLGDGEFSCRPLRLCRAGNHQSKTRFDKVHPVHRINGSIHLARWKDWKKNPFSRHIICMIMPNSGKRRYPAVCTHAIWETVRTFRCEAPVSEWWGFRTRCINPDVFGADLVWLYMMAIPVPRWLWQLCVFT